MNLQNTLEYIASVAHNHPLINSSYVGSIYDLNSNTNTKYAVFAVEDIDVTKQNNTLLYNCYLYVVDRVMNDESNTIAVQTMAVNTLQEIINYIEGYSQSLEVYGSYIITPVRQKFSDECAGAYVQLRLVSQNDIGDCAFSDDKVVEIFQGKTYLLDNYFTKSETLTLLDGKQDTLIAGDNITIVDNVISATGSGGDSVWEKDANNNIFPKGNTNVTGKNCFVTGLTSKANHNNNISIGYNNESRGNNSIVIGVQAKDFDPSGDELGWSNLIAMGNNPVIPPQSLNTPYKTWQTPKFIVGGFYGFKRWNTLEQTVNGDLYIKGINGWDGTNATPDGTSHLQGYLSGLDTRITNNTTAISVKQDTISAGDGIDVTNNVVSVDNTVAKKTDVYTKAETDSLLGEKQNTLTAGTGISITNNTVSCTVDISGKEDKALSQTFTNNASLTLADNTIYTASEPISLLSLDAQASGTSVVSFDTASSGAITITLQTGIKFAETPTFGNNEHWEIAIRNGYGVYTKYDLV